MKNLFLRSLTIMLFCWVASRLPAQVLPGSYPPGPWPDPQWEANQRALVAAQWTAEQPIRLPEVGPAPEGPPIAPAEAAPVLPPTVVAAPPPAADDAKKFAWTKGDFKVVPYGILWGNMVYATQRAFPGTFSLYTLSPTTGTEHEFIVDARSTRLGVDVSGPSITLFGTAQTGGKVEVDFQQSILGLAGAVFQENRAAVQLRHAYGEVKNDDYRLLAGQTMDVISPLFPGILMFSVGWDAGNIGFRRAQLRGERYLACSDTVLFTLQGSVNQNVFESTGAVRSEPAGWPIVEGRAAVVLGNRKGPGALPITIGFSGHIGEEQYDVTGGPQNLHRTTWSANADMHIPITARLGFQAELFTGQNLDAFFGGIGQGIDNARFNPIHSTGGWCEFWYDWTPRWHSHFGYSLDDPNDGNLHATGERRYNQFVFTNLIHDVTKQFLVGMEVSSWKTLYIGQPAGESLRCEFVAKYVF